MRESKSNTPRKAYSYLRFSTAEQRAGDSFRRQTELAKRYATANGLMLDDQLSYHDLGVSGFSGANARDGKLAEFLEAVDRGVVAKGSYLLVESLDRISRQNPYDALSILQRIVDSGVTLVTLMGEPKIYNATTVRQNPMALMEFLLIATRAHEESATKQRRAKEAWKASLAKAAKGEARGASACPAWIRPSADGTSWELIPERVLVIRRIFELARGGMGKDSIAKTLNGEGVRPFNASRWWGSYVYRILTNPAIIGEHTPKEKIEDHTGIVRVQSLKKLQGYYPAAITRKLWDDVVKLQKTNPRRGRHATREVANIFGGIAVCPRCGGAMTRVSKGSTLRAWPYLVCASAKAGVKDESGKPKCVYKSVGYSRIETAFLDEAQSVASEAPKASAKGRQIERERKNLEAGLSALEDRLENLLKVAAKADATPSVLVTKIQELERERAETMTKLRKLDEAGGALDKTLIASRLDELKATAKALATARGNDAPPLRTALNAILRRLLAAVVVDYTGGQLRFHWHHSDEETALTYSFPEA